MYGRVTEMTLKTVKTRYIAPFISLIKIIFIPIVPLGTLNIMCDFFGV